MQLNCIIYLKTCERFRIPDNRPLPPARRISAPHPGAPGSPGPPVEVRPAGFPRRSLAEEENTILQQGDCISNPAHPAKQGNRTCGAGNRRGVEILRARPFPRTLPGEPPPLRVQEVQAHELSSRANHALRRSARGHGGGGQTVRRIRHLCRVCRFRGSGQTIERALSAPAPGGPTTSLPLYFPSPSCSPDQG